MVRTISEWGQQVWMDGERELRGSHKFINKINGALIMLYLDN